MTPAADKGAMRRIVVLDTNVLLADPNSLLSFPRAEVVIPETVLGELDKLKTARVDPDLRFRGREVSRILFEYSEEGSLVGGVDLPDGGRLRVAPIETDSGELPEGLGTRNADDKILATAYQVHKSAGPDTEVELITNDLNMLLKAQTLGIPVARHGDGIEGGFARRYIIRPFQRYKIPLAILAIALGVFAAVIVLAIFLRQPGRSGVPTEFRELLSPQQLQALDALTVLEGDPNDSDALLAMGNFYFGQATAAQQAGDRAAEIQSSKNGVRYYQQYLELEPEDEDARADMASLLFYSGQTDRAIQEVANVLETSPDHVNANYNLGIFYWQGRRDLQAAADQMLKVVELTENDPRAHATLESARAVLTQIQVEAAETGQSVETTQGAQQ